MKKHFFALALILASSITSQATSLVLTLKDNVGTKVYYKVSRNTKYTTPLSEDGTICLCGRTFELSDIEYFSISSTDFSGEVNTEDGTLTAIAEISEDSIVMSGTKQIFDTNGKLIKTVKNGDINLGNLPVGTYVITNGTSTLKVCKR